MDASGREQAAASDVARYAPARIVLAGLRYALFGGLALSIPVLIGYFVGRPLIAQPIDPELAEAWPGLLAAGVVFALFALLTLPKGIGLLFSAFAKNCYLRADRDGITLRYPLQGWIGRYRVRAFQFGWDEIEKPENHAFGIVGIPAGRELRIIDRKGGQVRIERYYFAERVETIRQRLLDIRAGWVEAMRQAGIRQEAGALLMRAQRHEAAEKLEAAAEAAAAAVRLDPGVGEAHQWLGYFLFRLGRYGDAVVAFRSAAALEPENALHHYSIGRSLLQDGKLEAAAVALYRSVQLDPDAPDAHLSLGLTMLALEDLDGARGELAVLERIDPQRAAELSAELVAVGRLPPDPESPSSK
jgi:Tetratricopeptide repeat